jgi:hypothetical protein
MVCIFLGCDRPKAAKGLCAKHYAAYRREMLVADGMCGQCGRPRRRRGWLCNDCAARHRERQRVHDKSLGLKEVGNDS